MFLKSLQLSFRSNFPIEFFSRSFRGLRGYSTDEKIEKWILEKGDLFEKNTSLTNLKPWHLDPHFVGRENTLQKIDQILQQNTSCTLYGPSGMGKSQIAHRYGVQNLAQFSQVWRVNCQNIGEMYASYLEIAQNLEILLADETLPLDILQKKVHTALEKNSQNPWLLIFDQLRVYGSLQNLPEKGGKILFVNETRPFFPQEKDFEIQPLEPQEALEFLENVTKKSPGNKLQELAERLKYYPLGLSLAGKAIREGFPIEDFLEDLAPLSCSSNEKGTYEQILRSIWKIHMKCLGELSLNWLGVCTHLYPHHIETGWIEDWLEKRGEPRWKGREIHENILSAYGIFEKKEGGAFSIHPFLYDVLSSSDSRAARPYLEEQKQLFKQVSSTTWDFERRVFPEKGNEKDWASPICDENGAPTFNKQILIENCLRFGWLRHFQGEYEEAIRDFSSALTLQKEKEGTHPDLPKTLNHLGKAWQAKGDPDKAIEFYHKALSALEELYEKQDHSQKASVLFNLGKAYSDKEDLLQSNQYYEQALSMLKRLDPFLGFI